MVSRKAFNVLIIIELFIAIVFFNIARTWSKYSIDILFFVICFTFANILGVNRVFAKEHDERLKYGTWIVVGIFIVMPFLRWLLF